VLKSVNLPAVNELVSFSAINIEGDSGPTNEFRLQVSRIEKHTVESLYQRNSQFYTLCEMEYDGMDVGK
jgi:hypothetical protein